MRTFAWILLPLTTPLLLDNQALAQGPQYLGAGSCAAAACHNSTAAAHGQPLTEYAVWLTRDKHALAYQVLFNEKSARIARNLGGPPAHKLQRCLGCHAGPDYVESRPPEKARYFKTDGVSCESCHGPASQWIGEHHLGVPRERLHDLGMNDTRSLLGRAQVCATCHIGSAGMDVNHDLIAAGHPRLHFEFAAFHEQMPRHWDDAKDRAGINAFEAQLWATGQLASTHAALDLLADRAGIKNRPWPEFAEFDCLACHHDLQAKGGRQVVGFGKRKAGAFPWDGRVELLQRAFEIRGVSPSAQFLELMHKLGTGFDAGRPEQQMIAQQARKAATSLQQSFAQQPSARLDIADLERIFDAVRRQASTATSCWDEFTRAQLALAALRRTRADMKLSPITLQIHNPLIKLDFTRYERFVNEHEPKSIRGRLSEYKKVDVQRGVIEY